MSINKKLIADKVINELSVDDKKYILNLSKDDLIKLHHTLGRHIRNKFNLWNYKWNPEIVNGIDISKQHPDEISMNIIEIIYEQLKGNANE